MNSVAACTVCGKSNTPHVCGGGCSTATIYCGYECQKIDWATHSLLCGPVVSCSSVKIGQVVVDKTGFVTIRILDGDEDEMYALARQYVIDKHLDKWKIRKPRAWTAYNSGVHVTLDKSMAQYRGEVVKVELGEIYHFVAESRWVAIHVRIPPKFKCPYNDCHISIGQEQLE